jgi:L-2-hydroxyglutarate oxidase LhgO
MSMRVVVIGAGAVGLAVARELAERGHEVFAFEAGAQPGGGITSRSSEVVHAGLYYEPGSLKARMCVEGRDMLYDYLARRGEGVRRCGKLVVASEPGEVAALESIAANARTCGVDEVELIDGDEARRREPAVRCVAALWSPSTGICDAHGLVRALRADFERAGGTLVTRAEVRAARRRGGAHRLDVRIGDVSEPFECDAVVNAAGLASDLVARMPFDEPPRHLPSHRFVKGSYARLRWPGGATSAPPGCLVYPLPNHDRPGLGIHLTIDLAGGLRLGPDAEELPDRVEDYTVSDEILPRFEAAARRYLDLPDGAEITPGYAGVRPVRSDARDFYVAEDLPRWVNLVGIESPGLTSALALGRHVSYLLGEQSR